MKKRILYLLLILFSSSTVFSQAPNSFKYQAVVRNASGTILTNQSVSFRLSIFRTSPNGVIVYSERHNVSTNSYGLANMNIGSGILVSGNFNAINWGNDQYFLQTEIDITGGTLYSTMGVSQLQSVPYALNAKTVSGMGIDDLTDVNTTGASTNQVLSWNGSNWVPTTASAGNTYSAGAGLSLSGTTFSAQNSSALWNANNLQGRSVSSSAPSTNQVLGWNGSQWSPQTVSSGSSPWTTSGSNIYRNTGNVAIGTSIPSTTRKLLVRGSVGTGIQSEVSGNYTVCNAVSGFSLSSNVTGENQGIYGEASNSTTANVGGIFISVGSAGSTNYGIFARATNATTNYAGYFNGNIGYTGTLTNVSDKRLKTNITPYTGALNKLMQLEIYRYDFSAKDDYSNLVLAPEKQYGFLAQDLEKLFPDLVHENKVPNKRIIKEDGSFDVIKGGAEYKSVNQIGMIPILTKAIQEQQKMIEQQQALIEKQNQLIESLDKRILTLEK